MIRNYILVTMRNIRRYPGYSAINIAGLAVGLACCILILLHVSSELQFDRFHANADRIYRVLYLQDGPRGDQTFGRNMPPLADALSADIPEVQSSTNFMMGWRLTVKNRPGTHQGIISRNYFFSGPETFAMFDFPFRSGEASIALKEPGAVVLSSEKAEQLFGTENPVGKPLYIEAEDFPEFVQQPFTVTGVLDPLPSNSHLQFDFLISRSTLARYEQTREWLGDWDNYLASTYVMLKPGSEAEAVNPKLPAFTDKFVPKEEGYTKGFVLQPLSDIHFGSQEVIGEANALEGDRAYIQVFAIIALFIAGIACVNYVNLATARAMRRAKEIALRKVIGAERLQMAGQFLAESVLHSIIATAIAIGLVEAFLPAFNRLAGSALTLGTLASLPAVLGLCGLSLAIGLAAGSYPAFYLSGLTPNLILRGGIRSGRSAGRLRSVLVVAQFVVTIVILVATLVVSRQVDFVTSKDLGFNKERLIVFDINHDAVQENFTSVKTELLRNASIKSVTVSSRVPGDWKGFRQVSAAPADDMQSEPVRMAFNGVDEDFLATYEIDLVEGRNFSRALATDSNAVIVNASAAAALFEGSPIGKRLRFSSSPFVGIVVGVMNDIHISSLHDAIRPMVLGFMPLGGRHALHGIDYFTIRMASADVESVVEFVTGVHEKFDPVNPIELGFLDQWWDELYERDRRLGSVFGVSALLTILIACIGLFGLASYIAEQRTKEIGVRKVLGASIGGIVALLSRDFALFVLAGCAVAFPLAGYLMQMWLESFAYRVSLTWVDFAASGCIALVVALLTVSIRTVRAALSNPVASLKYE